MGQHLYPCESGKHDREVYGLAHYVLRHGRLILLCKECWKEWKASGERETGLGPASTLGN